MTERSFELLEPGEHVHRGALVAEPLFFGPDERPLFGWVHQPIHRAPASLGLILCNPFGYEAICAHRSLSHFAAAAAAAGVPALRFDYDGTGDSAGCDLDADRLSAWIASIHEAAETLRRETRCERFCLLGIRLGATLAAIAASRRADVEALIAIAPVVRAKGYLRELRALQMATGLAPPPAPPSAVDLLEVTGFVLTAATRAALAEVDLSELARAPAAQILILDRDDLPGSEQWAARLEATGAKVERLPVPGYVEMMLDPHASIVPEQMLRKTTAWLAERAGPVSGAKADPGRPSGHASFVARRSIHLPSVAGAGVPITETAEFLDPERTLFGILSAPQSTSAARPTRPAQRGILMLNAGSTHHIGPNRLYVALARRWASLGHIVLRLDISGIGDSLPRPGELENVVYTPCAGADIAQAVRYLRERAGVTECHALGLCSGAYHAFKAAVNGASLDAVVMINPLTFFWKKGMSLDAPMPDQRVIAEAKRYQRTGLRAQSWLKLLRGRVDVRDVAHVMLRRMGFLVKHYCRDLARHLHYPLSDDLGRELAAAAVRRIGMLFVFAAHDPGIELLHLQGGSRVGTLRRRRQLDIRIIDWADHTFTALQAREQLVSVLAGALDGEYAHPPLPASGSDAAVRAPGSDAPVPPTMPGRRHT